MYKCVTSEEVKTTFQMCYQLHSFLFIEKGSVAPPSLPSRPVNRAPVPAPPKSSKATTKSASAAGINIDSGALGSALKGLKRVINNTPKDEEKSTGGSEILTHKLNIKEAINKFETGDKPGRTLNCIVLYDIIILYYYCIVL